MYDINGAGTALGNYTTSFYGEYGLSRRLTAITYVPFLVRNTVNEGVGAITGEVPQLGLTYEHKGEWGLSALVGGAVSGRNALASPAFSLGVFGKL